MKQMDWNHAMEAPSAEFHGKLQSVLYALPEQEEPVMKKTWNIRRVGALALAAVMILSIGVAAASNFGYMKTTGGAHALKSAEAVVKVLEKEAVDGLTADAKFLEEYSNGFTFVKATLESVEARNEDDPTVYNFQGVSAWYDRDGVRVDVNIRPVIEGLTDELEGDAVECGDVTLYTVIQQYKIVPLDYEPTEEEAAAVAAGELIFSYDDALDAPENVEQRFVAWIQDDMFYSMNNLDAQVSLDELVTMAQELVNS